MGNRKGGFFLAIKFVIRSYLYKFFHFCTQIQPTEAAQNILSKVKKWLTNWFLARLSGFSLLENFFDAGSSVFSRIGVPGWGLNRL